MPDFLPRRDQNFISFTGNLSARVSAGYASLGLPEAMAVALAEAHAELAAAWQETMSPVTATVPATSRKNQARRRVTELVREINGRVRGRHVSEAQLIQLGLKPRKTTRTRFGRPELPPGISVELVGGREVEVRLYEYAKPEHRALPRGVIGAVILWQCSEREPAADGEGWKVHSMTGRTRLRLEIDHELPPGARIWLTASWMSRSAGLGPRCSPASVHLGAQGVSRLKTSG